MNTSIDSEQIDKQLHVVLTSFRRHMAILFFLLLTSLYAFLIWRINVLSSAPPSQEDISSATQSAPKPKISEEVVRTLQGLEDNSVRVQAIFNQARQNPFQE
ncbi:hypothetical protein IPL68_01795 [Candidatus Saccharibacteria bacterium]|nr:MAG: hypothetical protein IPL68_01795 [Candidatus Saccharibacteria bacterium]